MGGAIDARSFVRFVFVGAAGFAVDAGVLALLLAHGWDAVAARSVAIPVAVYSTWVLNRAFTFPEAQSGPALRSLARYAGVSAVGACVNFAVYAALLLAVPLFARHPMAALAVASAIALLVNYLGSKHYAFRQRPLRSAP